MCDEFVVFAPKSTSKKYNVMRFNTGDKVDIKRWTKADLSRDLSAKKQYDDGVEYPEFGEGSEYGKRRREEAKRLKYGRKQSRFIVENQPWDLTISSVEYPKTMDEKKKKNIAEQKPKIVSKDFHGKKEGGIGEGSMYFIFTQRPDHSFEAYPVQDWCNFSRKISHRTLTDEEAEAAWDQRDKIRNHLNYMARKRLNIEEVDEDQTGPSTSGSGGSKEGKKKGNNTAGDLLIHDDEEAIGFITSSSDEDDNDDKKKKKKQKQVKRKRKEDEEGEDKEDGVGEESDDGEKEGVEIAYDTDVSSSDEEVEDDRVAPKGVDEQEEESSSSEDEEDEKKKEDEKKRNEKQQNKLMDSSDSDMDSDEATPNNKKLSLAKKLKKERSRSNTPTAIDRKKENVAAAVKSASMSKQAMTSSAATSSAATTSRSSLVTSSTTSGGKKRSADDVTSGGEAKRQKLMTSQSKGEGGEGITAEAVRRILMHKPITIPKLLKKFRSSGLDKNKICDRIGVILRNLKLCKSEINGRVHLFLKN